jgi:nitroreductase
MLPADISEDDRTNPRAGARLDTSPKLKSNFRVCAYIDRSLSYGQWMDLGMFLQSLMLLCEDHGLATCAQGYWTFFHDNVRAVTSAPDDLMLACGLAIGFEDTESPNQPSAFGAGVH